MRDLLPEEAEEQGALASKVQSTFQLFGYQPVILPAFEYAEVLERGLGGIEPTSILRFVEPETGEVVALRPDMTPQVARLVSTRLSDRPGPWRLCYRGSVLRRQHERARHDQQVLQAGVELVGAEGGEADLEVIRAASTAVRDTGLQHFVLDLGHGALASSLLSTLDVERRQPLLEALSLKDRAELIRRAADAGLPQDRAEPLAALVGLQGGLDVFDEARQRLAGTPALAHAEELERLARAVVDLNLVPQIIVDLGETRAVAYYTGPMFQILAEGPGQAVASGGRYDALYGMFGPDRPAAGAAIHVDHLRWALGKPVTGNEPRVLVCGGPQAVLDTLRDQGIRAAYVTLESPIDYARAWRYSHLVRPLQDGSGLAVSLVESAGEKSLGTCSTDELAGLIRSE